MLGLYYANGPLSSALYIMKSSPDLGEPPVYVVVARSNELASRSGLYPLTEAIPAHACVYKKVWLPLSKRSWTLGHNLRRFGQWYYRSEWNSLVPLWHDLWMRRRIPRGQSIVHFLFPEFAAPRDSGFLRRRGAQVIGTFHTSARRQERVHGEYPLENYDWISVVSKTQIPWFLDRGYPKERIRVTYHGVDTNYFRPAPRTESDILRLLLVGSTERDHDFMSRLCRALNPKHYEVTVLTNAAHHALYRDIPCVRVPAFLPDKGLLAAYQQADLMVMPLLDCTANNAVLEAMACGTPVLTNRVGGIPEYVSDACNDIMPNKKVDEWAACLEARRSDRSELKRRRTDVRGWAEEFAWTKVADQFRALYTDACAASEGERRAIFARSATRII